MVPVKRVASWLQTLLLTVCLLPTSTAAAPAVSLTVTKNSTDCIGRPFPCAAYNNVTLCRMTYGCKVATSSTYSTGPHCVYDSTEQSAVCNDFDTDDACVARGCSWVPSTVPGLCSGAVPCDIRTDNSTCWRTWGCSWSSSGEKCQLDSSVDVDQTLSCGYYSSQAVCQSQSCTWTSSGAPPMNPSPTGSPPTSPPTPSTVPATSPGPAPNPTPTFTPIVATLTPNPTASFTPTPTASVTPTPTASVTPSSTASVTSASAVEQTPEQTAAPPSPDVAPPIQPDDESGVAAKAGAIIGAVGGPTLVVIAYLAITFAYSSEKRMIIQQVKQHLTLKDTAADPAALTALSLHDQRQHLHHAMRIAGKVTAGCLSRWDGLFGLRAAVDSNSKRSGIWMDKFETVRFGSMLLAFRRVNTKRAVQGKCNIFSCWDNLYHKEQEQLLSDIADELQIMSHPDDMRNLPHDPEMPGLNYKMRSMLQSCCICCRRRGGHAALHLPPV